MVGGVEGGLGGLRWGFFGFFLLGMTGMNKFIIIQDS